MLDRQLLNGWCHGHENCRLCLRPHSHERVIFFPYFLDSYVLSYGEFGELIMKLSRAALRPLLAAHERGALPLVRAAWGVTARNASHNARNVRGVAAGKMGRNSSSDKSKQINQPHSSTSPCLPYSASTLNTKNQLNGIATHYDQ